MISEAIRAKDPALADLCDAAAAFVTANSVRALELGPDALVVAVESKGKRSVRLTSIAETVTAWRARGDRDTPDAVDRHAREGAGVIVAIADEHWIAGPIKWGSRRWPGGEIVEAAKA